MVEVTKPAEGQAANQNPTPPAGGNAGEQQQQQQGEKMVPLAALQESRDQIRDLKAQVELMQTMNPYGNQPQQQRQPDPGFGVQQPQHNQMDELWQSDPRRAMQAEISMALNWYDRTNASLDIQENQIAQKHADFDKYRTNVRQYLRTLAPEQRTKQGIVEMAYYLAKGQKADDLVNMSREDLIAKIRAGEEVQGFTQGTVSQPASPPQSSKPTQQQVDAARAFGQPIEEYMKHVINTGGR